MPAKASGPLLLVVLILASADPLAAVHVDPGPQPVDVLVIHSYHQGFDWTDGIHAGLQAELAESGREVALYTEYLDARRPHREQAARLLAERLRFFRAESDWRIVVVSDDPALDFVLGAGRPVLEGLPVVACGLDSSTHRQREVPEHVTPIYEVVDIAGVIDLARHWQPDLTSLALIHDESAIGRENRRRAEEVLAGHPELSAIWLGGYDEAGLADALAEVPEESAVLWTAWFRMPDGRVLDWRRSVEVACAASPAPVYSCWEFSIGAGPVGGPVVGCREHGATAMRLALARLDGAAVAATSVAPKLVIDHAALRHWGLDPALVPPAAAVVNAPEPVVETYGEWLLLALAVVVLQGALLVYLVANVLARRRMARRLTVQQKAMIRAQRTEAIGQMAGGIAHDFNNILQVIRGYAELLRRRSEAGGDAERQLKRLLEATERGASLTNQLLAFSRREALRPTLVDLNRIVRRVEDMVRRVIPERIELRSSLHHEPLVVRVDEPVIEQVVLNLCLNARDAIEGSGVITLTTDATPQLVGTDKRESQRLLRPPLAVLRVSDDGCGMEEEVRQRIFDPFFTTKPTGAGTGLGLAMVQAAAEGHGGLIQVASQPGAGAIFELVLSALTAPAEDEESQVSGPHSVIGGSVLVVEDEPDVRQITADMLSDAGYQVTTAGDAETALGMLEAAQRPPDVVLMDVVMPGMGGAEGARRIRERWPHQALLLMSGYAGERERRGVPAGLQVLAKPFTGSQLIQAIAAIRRQSSDEQAPASVRPLRVAEDETER